MNVSTGNLADNWKYFEEDWKNWSTATKLNAEASEVIVAALYHTMGRETREIARNLKFDNREDPSAVLQALKEHFVPKKNVTYERYVFNTSMQNDEPIDMYINRLRQLAESCDFGDLKESLIRDRLVIGLSDNQTRERLLREDDLTLNKCLQICRAAERTSKQMKAMVGVTDTVHRVGKTSKSPKATNCASKECKYCGTKHAKKQCPAFGKQCSRCKKK